MGLKITGGMDKYDVFYGTFIATEGAIVTISGTIPFLGLCVLWNTSHSKSFEQGLLMRCPLQG